MNSTNTILKVVSIIMIIGSVLGAGSAIILAGTFVAVLGGIEESFALLILVVPFVMALVSSAINLAAGILGLRHTKHPQNKGTLLLLGGLSLLFAGLAFAINYFFADDFNLLAGVAGFVLPVLYLFSVSKSLGREDEVI